MNEKISWYREVLELEPDSRLFYPLAVLLEEAGEPEEACAVLARGAVRHPAFLEARFHHVELLRRLGRQEEAARETAALAPVFARHGEFWQSWALDARAASLDRSLALRLMGLAVRGLPVSFADLLRRGLDSLEAELAAGLSGQPRAKERPPVSPTVAVPLAPEAGSAADASPRPAPSPLSAVPLTPGPDKPSSLPDPPAAETGAYLSDLPELPDLPEEEIWPPRTRTMAEVLAEQGEFTEAAAIYRELLGSASPADRGDLSARLAELDALAGGRAPDGESAAGPAAAAPSGETPPAADGSASGSGESAPGGPDLPPASLVNMLEALASRMEARIH